VVSTSARLHSNDASWDLADNLNKRLPPHRSADSHRTFVVDANNVADAYH